MKWKIEFGSSLLEKVPSQELPGKWNNFEPLTPHKNHQTSVIDSSQPLQYQRTGDKLWPMLLWEIWGATGGPTSTELQHAKTSE